VLAATVCLLAIMAAPTVGWRLACCASQGQRHH
jgi:hypothetical protein